MTDYTYTQTVIDSFPGTTLNASNWNNEPSNSGGVSASVSSGSLIIPIDHSVSGLNSEVEVDSVGTWNLADGIWAIKRTVTGLPADTSTTDPGDVTGGEIYFGLWSGSDGSGPYIELQMYPNFWSYITESQGYPSDNFVTTLGSSWVNGTWFGVGNYDLNNDGNCQIYSSSDGETWTEVGTVQVSRSALNINAAGVYLGTEWLSGNTAWSTSYQDASFFTRGTGGGGGGTTPPDAGSLWYPGSFTVTGSGAGNAGTIGTHFTTSEAGTLSGLALYSAPGQGLSAVPSTIGLFNASAQALIHSETASWSGAAGSGWITASFSSPPSLTAGTGYMASAFSSDSTGGWFALDDAFTYPASNGDLEAPDGGWYTNTATTSIAYPATQDSTYNWGLDVLFAPAAVWEPFQQETSGSSTTTSLTMTFPSALTFGNTLVVALAGHYDGTVTGITVGGSAVTSVHAGSAGGTGGNNADIFIVFGIVSTSTEVEVTTSAAGILGWCYEIAGTCWVDVAAGAIGTGASWSSGATGETVPFPHVTVGVGAAIGNTGTVTGPGSGWTNGTSYSDVAGAGGHAIGGVSGYQVSQGSGTYTYSGTAADSSAWGACAVSLLAAQTGVMQPGWGGLVFYEHASYTAITATFSIPDTVPNNTDALVSIWIGLGNVYQVGIYLQYSASAEGGVGTAPWCWWLAGSGELWDLAAYPTGAGDTLVLTMELTAENWLMTIADTTQGWSYTEIKSALAVNTGSWDNAEQAQWPYPLQQAEVIIEKEGTYQVVDYGTIEFTEVTTVPAATVAPSVVFTGNTTIDQYPGVFDLENGSFTMYYNAAD